MKAILKKYIFPQSHPWRRLGAKLFDLELVKIITFPILGFLLPDSLLIGIKSIDPIFGITLFTTINFLLLIPFEGFFMSRFSTTPGKWLLGMTIKTKDEKALSFKLATQRSFIIFLKASGFGFPPLALYLYSRSYRSLIRSGTTPWDVKHYHISHRPWSFMRATITSLFFFLLVSSYLFYSFI